MDVRTLQHELGRDRGGASWQPLQSGAVLDLPPILRTCLSGGGMREDGGVSEVCGAIGRQRSGARRPTRKLFGLSSCENKAPD